MKDERDFDQFIAGWRAGCHEGIAEALKLVARLKSKSGEQGDPLAAWWAQYFQIRTELERLREEMTR